MTDIIVQMIPPPDINISVGQNNLSVDASPSNINASVNNLAVNITMGAMQGPQGLPGISAGRYIHTQNTAASVWTINHNLGYYPEILLLTVGGMRFIGEVLHTTINQAVVQLSSSYTGTAHCL